MWFVWPSKRSWDEYVRNNGDFKNMKSNPLQVVVCVFDPDEKDEKILGW